MLVPAPAKILLFLLNACSRSGQNLIIPAPLHSHALVTRFYSWVTWFCFLSSSPCQTVLSPGPSIVLCHVDLPSVLTPIFFFLFFISPCQMALLSDINPKSPGSATCPHTRVTWLYYLSSSSCHMAPNETCNFYRMCVYTEITLVIAGLW